MRYQVPGTLSMMMTTTTTTAIKHNRNSRIRVNPQCARRRRPSQLAMLQCCYHLLLVWTMCMVNQFVSFATADMTTSLLSESDDIVDELIDAELLSVKPLDVVVVASEEDDSDSSGEDIILLDDIGDDTITVDPVDSMQSTDANKSTTDTGGTDIHVQSNLQSLLDEELIAICTERGYEITVENDTAGSSNGTAAEKVQLTHDDYVNAATQCLSMDKVVNQMIADDPEIAADMEQEVERIRLEKEKLQQEQDTILHEISTLEEELRQSGVDPKSIVATPPNAGFATTKTLGKNLTDLTVDEVLQESFVQLFDRVGNDLQFIARMAQYAIVQPAWTSITFLWRSVSPTVMEAVVRPVTSYGKQHVIPLIQQVLVPLQPYIEPMRQMVVQQYSTVRNSIVTPIVRYINSSIIQTQLRQWFDHQRDEVQLGIRIVGAFVIPLFQSLSTGYQVFLHPIIRNVTLTTMSLVQQLSSEASAISAS